MKITAIGDQFIRYEVMLDVVKKFFPEAETNGYNTGWPLDMHQSVYKSEGNSISEYDGTEEDVIAAAREADYLILDIAPVSEKVLDSLKNLKAIAVTRGGMVNVDLEAAQKRGIPVFSSPGRNLTAVAEFTVALALAHMKNIPVANRDLKNGVWRGDFYSYGKVGKEMSDIKVGVIGFGNIGRQVSKMFHSLGSDVHVFDPFVPREAIEESGYTFADVDGICETCNLITVHARVTPENIHMIGEKQLALMNSDTVLINTARAELIDMDALYEALKKHKIGGAALDVFEKEPLSKGSRYMELDNLTMTPHIGGASLATIKRAVNMAIADLAAFDNEKQKK